MNKTICVGPSSNGPSSNYLLSLFKGHASFLEGHLQTKFLSTFAFVSNLVYQWNYINK